MKGFAIGMEASISKLFEGEDVIKFAEISGDVNPVHLDKEYAKGTLFGRRIVHGFLYSSLISSVLANQLPGPGSIYLNQELNFLKPVFWGDTITATVQITAIKPEKNVIYLKTTCSKSTGEMVVDGSAVIKLL
jgi:3-hydroxybutyryl-CoA dehydratase